MPGGAGVAQAAGGVERGGGGAVRLAVGGADRDQHGRGRGRGCDQGGCVRVGRCGECRGAAGAACAPGGDPGRASWPLGSPARSSSRSSRSPPKARPSPCLLSACSGWRRRRCGGAQSERFVGREGELAALRALWNEAVADERCVLATVVGTPGVGKSHLAERLLADFDTRVLRGRCPRMATGSPTGRW